MNTTGRFRRCAKCGESMGGRATYRQLGLRQHAGQGMCSACYTRVVRRGTAAAATKQIPPRPQWMLAAPCATVDPEIFFPNKGENATPAKKICAGCPYKAPCLTAAVEQDEQFGIFGGLAPKERRGLDLFAELEDAA